MPRWCKRGNSKREDSYSRMSTMNGDKCLHNSMIPTNSINADVPSYWREPFDVEFYSLLSHKFLLSSHCCVLSVRSFHSIRLEWSSSTDWLSSTASKCESIYNWRFITLSVCMFQIFFTSPLWPLFLLPTQSAFDVRNVNKSVLCNDFWPLGHALNVRE